MLSRFKIRSQLLILFFSGASAGFSIYSIYLAPLLIFGYCYFLKNLETTKTKENALYCGVIFGTGYFFGCLHWIVFPFMIYEKHLILAFYTNNISNTYEYIFWGFCYVNLFNKKN